MQPSKYGTASNSWAVNWSAVVSASMNASYSSRVKAQLRYAPSSPAPSIVSLPQRDARKATDWSMDSIATTGAMAS